MLVFTASSDRLYLAYLHAQPPRTPEVPAGWFYVGDGNVEDGGSFLNITQWPLYVEAVRVGNLGDAIGFDGAVLIEHVVISSCNNSATIRESLASYGSASECLPSPGRRRHYTPEDIKRQLRLMIAEALLCYGHYDMDEAWDGWEGPASETIQTEQDGDMSFDGWRADARLDPDTDLWTYLIETHLTY